MSTLPQLHVTIHDEKEKIFDGSVVAVSSFNEKGSFDILYEHTNFITLISDKIVLHTTVDTKKEFAIESGVLECLQTEVTIYLGV